MTLPPRLRRRHRDGRQRCCVCTKRCSESAGGVRHCRCGGGRRRPGSTAASATDGWPRTVRRWGSSGSSTNLPGTSCMFIVYLTNCGGERTEIGGCPWHFNRHVVAPGSDFLCFPICYAAVYSIRLTKIRSSHAVLEYRNSQSLTSKRATVVVADVLVTAPEKQAWAAHARQGKRPSHTGDPLLECAEHLNSSLSIRQTNISTVGGNGSGDSGVRGAADGVGGVCAAFLAALCEAGKITICRSYRTLCVTRPFGRFYKYSERAG